MPGSVSELNWFDQLNWVPSGFAHPQVLWLLAIPMLLLSWTWIRRSGSVPLPLDHSVHSAGAVTRTLLNLAESSLPILLAVVIWILAGPMELGKPTTKRSLTNIQFCVDISGSMTSSFGAVGSRYDGSMQAINEFLDFRQGDAFGLTFFGNEVLHWCPLTTDASAIRCSVPFMRPEIAPPWFGGTQIAKALLACRQKLMETEEGDRMIILVSDGSSFDLNPGNASDIAQRMSDEGITVFAIHIANSAPPEEIVTVTTKTGGDVFNPGDEEALANVFRVIDSMKMAEMEKTIAEQLDNFQPFALLGMGLLLLLVGCSFGLRYTPW